ncbi:hypothetical protein [Clostridium tyrobutyricum]|uniref:hypothetical protein n=1 Tax=Clostridium tyrobutyricum TaxID=1519 RepID=UPI001C3951AE|nr:hypothetical protein [Clostridium tyrobutyricum]MBV4416975.1 hypothetical protein [Clostridium tyrobutyricum]
MSNLRLKTSLKLDIIVCIIFLISSLFSFIYMKYSVAITNLIVGVIFLFAGIRTYKLHKKD